MAFCGKCGKKLNDGVRFCTNCGTATGAIASIPALNNDSVVLMNSGLAHFKEKNYNQAIADYTKSILLDVNSAAAYCMRGTTYLEMNDYEKAIADFTESIRLNPNNEDAYAGRGMAYSRMNDYDKAIADCNQAIRLNVSYAVAYYARSMVYSKNGDNDKAISDLELILQIDPNIYTDYDEKRNFEEIKKNAKEKLGQWKNT